MITTQTKKNVMEGVTITVTGRDMRRIGGLITRRLSPTDATRFLREFRDEYPVHHDLGGATDVPLGIQPDARGRLPVQAVRDEWRAFDKYRRLFDRAVKRGLDPMVDVRSLPKQEPLLTDVMRAQLSGAHARATYEIAQRGIFAPAEGGSRIAPLTADQMQVAQDSSRTDATAPSALPPDAFLYRGSLLPSFFRHDRS